MVIKSKYDLDYISKFFQQLDKEQPTVWASQRKNNSQRFRYYNEQHHKRPGWSDAQKVKFVTLRTAPSGRYTTTSPMSPSTLVQKAWLAASSQAGWDELDYIVLDHRDAISDQKFDQGLADFLIGWQNNFAKQFELAINLMGEYRGFHYTYLTYED